MDTQQITFNIAADDYNFVSKIASKVELTPSKIVEVLITVVLACEAARQGSPKAAN